MHYFIFQFLGRSCVVLDPPKYDTYMRCVHKQEQRLVLSHGKCKLLVADLVYGWNIFSIFHCDCNLSFVWSIYATVFLIFFTPKFDHSKVNLNPSKVYINNLQFQKNIFLNKDHKVLPHENKTKICRIVTTTTAFFPQMIKVTLL